MQIGRAVPIYWVEMMKNNHIKFDITDALTRFMTMEKPIMNDFEVNIGAYFVPYVALDRLTNNDFLKKNWTSIDASHTTAKYMSYNGLDARKFFNPATPNSDRVPPVMLDWKQYTQKVGSIYDHLGMPPANLIVNGNVYGFSFQDGAWVYDEYSSVSDATDYFNSIISSEYGALASVGNSLTPDKIILTPWLYFNKRYSAKLSSQRWDPDTIEADFISQYVDMAQQLDSQDILFTQLLIDGTALLPNGSYLNWDYSFVSREAFLSQYIDYFNGMKGSLPSQKQAPLSIIPLMAYLRIYGDYFLNELYNNREDFFDICSIVYSNFHVDEGSSIAQGISIAEQSLGTHRDHWFFADYLAKGECFPVLWQTDYFTQCSPQTAVPAGDVMPRVQNGDTIPELFAKRMLARFQDLIARMGPNYADNMDALYGGHVPDSTLLRSQVLGVKTLNVHINAIQQTAPTTSNGAFGDFAGYAYTSAAMNGTFEWTAEEPGLIMALCWIRPRNVAYTSQVRRFFFKKDYLDFLLPQYAGVGYQSVYKAEVDPYSFPANVDPLGHFSYQERYFEYYMVPNHVSGTFRTFANEYSVDRTFIGEHPTLDLNTPTDFLYITPKDEVNRIFMDTATDPILAEIHIEGSVTRQVPSIIRTDF